jgi:hypothetical protein
MFEISNLQTKRSYERIATARPISKGVLPSQGIFASQVVQCSTHD